MARKIGIIGNGNVGTALSRGLEDAGHEVQAVGKDPDGVRDLATWADIVFLAVPYAERQRAIDEAGASNLANKTLVDVTNALGEGMRFAGPADSSGAQELSRWAGADCSVVKAFNTVLAQHMGKGAAGDEQLSLFCAGDDPEAKAEVLAIGRDLGFDAIDAGPLENARWLETLGYLNIQLAYPLGLGTDGGFRYVHGASAWRQERPRRASGRRTEGRPAKRTASRAPSRTGARRAKAAKPKARGMNPRGTAGKPRAARTTMR